MRKDLSLLAAAATVAAFLSAGPAAVVAANGPPAILASGLGGPLHLSAGEHGTVTVSEEFAGRLTRIDAHGTKSVLYENADWDVAGNAQQGSTTYFLESQGAGPEDRVRSPVMFAPSTATATSALSVTSPHWKPGTTPTRTPTTASATCQLTAQRCCLPESLPLTTAKWIPIRTG